MTEPGPKPPTLPASGSWRTMRKGTQSCTECRRRKIRCNLVPGKSTCSPCSVRGSRCVDQRDENYAIAEKERVTLRERVARLESLLGSKLQVASGERYQDARPLNLFPSTAETSDIGAPVSGADHRAPFVSVLGDAELLWPPSSGADETSEMQAPPTPIGSANPPSGISPLFQLSEQKTKYVCETLRSALPVYDTIMSTLSKNGAWWSSFRYKTHAISQTPVEALAAFAARSYTSSNPAELGILVAAYARSSNQNHLYAIVDSLVISDSAYLATTEGMECLILLAKSYTDIGQPRRAWFMYRRGMAIAQLMGLYRRDADSLSQKMIWWTVYHGDRFTSLLLGLPYGFNDAHYGPIMGVMAEESGSWEQQFILRCAFIVGKVIDRNVMPSKPPFAGTVDLDEQMDAIAASTPESWWDTPAELPGPGPELDQIRERLLQQFYFFYVRIHLHLPFIVKSPTTSPYDVSRLACLEASRQMLRRFVILHAEVQGACLFECKTSDFVGFMAAVVLLLGLSSPSDMPNLRKSDEDLRLVASMDRILHKEEREKGCKIASQCRKTLQMLSGTQDDGPRNADSFAEPQKIVIPYFGNVLRRRVKRAPAQTLSGNAHSSSHGTPSPPSALLEPATSSTTEEQDSLADAHTIEYGGCSPPNSSWGSTHWEADSFGNFPTDGLSPWPDVAMMDVDQDWSLFLDTYGDSLGGV
ncbi:hypothetical protein FGG08_003197 [Glutinoglossum americanum]|uniref:Zn(2)-C6 fungal-type domain-containing protein n=1 Tax=Glutinoglossum americanum TaxID=1670608 RepID=A0A9P8IBK6_9PEZI|nr:hypothetical protein FGG08_003197 [Glutinoglossum americanum]